jgi:riboflavin kinase / FMN adenylyltransferase
LRLGPTAAAVGNFDGVHRGHAALVDEAVGAARESGSTPVVLTFEPHPSRVLSPDRAPSTLMTGEQKSEALSELGIGLVVVVPFTVELAALRPSRFAETVLVGGLGVSCVVVGEHFRFGRRRSGDLPKLRTLGAELGFEVRGVPPVLHEGLPISSTRIREAVARGDVGNAREMLGRPYCVDGRVGRGVGRGKTLGVPTANLEPENELLPRRGVYAGRCRTDGGAWPAVVNVGHRPTFGGGELVVEAPLIGFAGNLYESRLRVSFLERLRDEQTFPDVEALRAQIRSDVDRATRLLGSGE